MDGRRFDSLTRLLVAPSPRRTILRRATGAALATALARFGHAAAQICGRVGAACRTDANCCANSFCGVRDTCVCRSGFADEGGLCRGALQPGDPCTSTAQCSQTGGPTACGDNFLAEDGPKNCCRPRGGACSGVGQCCGSFRCSEGVCGGKLPPGATCTTATQCSQIGGQTACADNGLPGDGAKNCCRVRGGTCTAKAGCCGDLPCTGGRCCDTTPCAGRCCPAGQGCVAQDPELDPPRTERVCCPVERRFVSVTPGGDRTNFCCAPVKICTNPTTGQERCCFPDEVCLNDECCCDGCLGAKVCGGVCCPGASCCNGSCCPNNQVCARRRPGDPLTCVPANRSCAAPGDCLASETCVDGKCCSGDRVCERFDEATGTNVQTCCAYGSYCDQDGNNSVCCRVGQICLTQRRVRIRS